MVNYVNLMSCLWNPATC